MPTNTVKVTPGVRLEQTPTLLQTSLVASDHIRWRGGLPEKLGGWLQFWAFTIAGVARQLWAWEDLGFNKHLAVAGDLSVTVLTGSNSVDVTPQFNTSDTTPDFSTTSGSSLVSIVDSISNASIYDSVQVDVNVAVGGLIIFGLYPIVSVQSSTQYTIDAGANATSTVTDGGVVATYGSTNNSAFILVTLPAHGLFVGDSYAIALPVTVGGVTLTPGLYTVLTAPSSSTFTIGAPNVASSTATVSDNGGNVLMTYWITPSQILSGGGWGDGGWGLGSWGMSVPGPPVTGTKVTPLDWSLANFGPTLLLSPLNGPIFSWSPDSGLNGSQAIGNGPSHCTGFFVAMPQQQVVAYGASLFNVQDPLLVAWSDNANYNVWAASAANQAGVYTLTRGSKIIGGLQGPQQGLLWTDVGLWLMQYIGYPDVYGFFEIAQGCGLISRDAAVTCGGSVYWMGIDGFWVFTGGAVSRFPCEVWDQVFPASINLNENFLYNIRAGANTSYDEVWWQFPSASSTGENDSYIKVNRVTGEWDFGFLTITAWIDNNVFIQPISAMTDATGSNALIMQHEVSPDANQQALPYSYRTGFFMLSEGEDKVFVDWMLPDFKWNRQNQPQTTSAQVLLTLYTQDDPDNPTEPAAVYGPYIVTNATGAIEPRARGRYFSIEVSGQDQGSFSRLGGVKFRFAPDGRN